MTRLAVVALALALFATACGDDSSATTTTTAATTAAPTTAPATTAAPTTTAPATTQIAPPPGVEVIEVDSVAHTEEPVEYPTDPPIGGPHHPTWLACRPYSRPVPNENAVHALEHGAVWIAYSPDLPADQVALLEDEFGRVREVIVSPYPDLESPVTVVSWGRLLRLDGADVDTITQFIQVFRDATAPEPGAGC